MPFRRKKMTKGKGHSTHSGTLVLTTGPASAPNHFRIVETQGGQVTADGTVQSYADERRTDETCNVGDLVKYINVFIETGPNRNTGVTQENGWLEWAVIAVKEQDIVIPITNLGTQTLGVIANRMYPTRCLLTGFIPVGLTQCNGAVISIKVPRKNQFLAFGDSIEVVTFFRTSNITSTATDTNRALVSYIYKAYQ